jgi:hypothetical protein
MSDGPATASPASAAKPLPPSASPRGDWLLVAMLIIAMLVTAVLFLHFAGRVWWCACRTPTPFSVHVWSSHNSQHLFDPYAFSHLLHGLIFFFAIRWLFPRLSFPWVLLLSLLIETGWEVLENSPMVIDRYRAATASLGYSGDSIVNTLGDILACAIGVWLARAIGFRWSLALFVLIELAMLALIRDNLTLNVIMLLTPVDAIREWQLQIAPATQPA